MKPHRFATFLALSLLVACTDQSPPGPGILTATLKSPNGAEGAALVVLMGPGIGEVTPVGSNQLYSNSSLDEVRIVLINQNDGTLAFRVEVADTTIEPAAIVEEVANPDNLIRSTLDGYQLEFRR
ncbi:uncharacterized protein METZ01_LOCUS5257 [marine metagenome]|mgnify:FL=1|uniref:Lipoprotein n=1 Tax=marine metagenome TaxID=408172 RepID=A0A381NFX0_9ZZZZ